jgi:hypothetical protein
MSNEVQKPNAGAMAVYQTLRAGVAQTRASMPVISGGTPFLRMLRDGTWAMGAQDSQIVAGTEAIINPLSIQHGYSCWTDRGKKDGKNEKLGEEMWKITQPKPMANTLEQLIDPRTEEPCTWKDQMSFELKLLDGKYKNEQALYSVTSTGGLRLIDALMKKLEEQLDTGSMYVFPIVRISSDEYAHSSYGKTFVPVMDILGWADMNGNEEGADADDAPAPAAKAEAPAPAVAETAPQDAPAGRRRRV